MAYANATNFDGENLFLIEGTLSELQTARVRVHLLHGMEQRLQVQQQVGDDGKSVREMYDALTNAAGESLLIDDDEAEVALNKN